MHVSDPQVGMSTWECCKVLYSTHNISTGPIVYGINSTVLGAFERLSAVSFLPRLQWTSTEVCSSSHAIKHVCLVIE
jgi:hypothetical protein